MQANKTETMELLHLLSLYQTILYEQIQKFFPNLTEDKLSSIMKSLKKKGRLSVDPHTGIISVSDCNKPDHGLIKGIWVLLDFITKIEYHSISDYPALLTFFAKNEMYEVLYIPEGQEAIMNHALNRMTKKEESTKRLVIIDSKQQIPQLNCQDIRAYCRVDPEGRIQYYKKE